VRQRPLRRLLRGIKFQAPHAIDATLSTQVSFRRLDVTRVNRALDADSHPMKLIRGTHVTFCVEINVVASMAKAREA